MESRVQTQRPRCRFFYYWADCKRPLFLALVSRKSSSQLFVKRISFSQRQRNPSTLFRWLKPLPLLSFPHPTSPSVKIPHTKPTQMLLLSWILPWSLFPYIPSNINDLSSYECSGHISNLTHDVYDTIPCILLFISVYSISLTSSFRQFWIPSIVPWIF